MKQVSYGDGQGRIKERDDPSVCYRREEDEGGTMDERPQEDRAEDRRRRGPLGDEGDAGEPTRRVRRAGSERAGGEEEEETGRIPADDEDREATTGAPEGASPTDPGEEDPETRVIRTPGNEGMPYPRGYLEAAEMREARLREVYGGVDWLASFIGCIFALICAGILLSLSGLVLVPLGFTLNLQQIDTLAIAGLVIVGIMLFVAFLCGGYVAGRLVRFDGGRTGAMTLGWALLLSVIFAVFGVFLPGPIFQPMQEFVQNNIGPALNDLAGAGLVSLCILIGALLLALLGGFVGGRLGNSYHVRIDETT